MSQMKETLLSHKVLFVIKQSLFDDIKVKEGGDETFRASKRWFTNFKQ
jgi:hypothetical protein